MAEITSADLKARETDDIRALRTAANRAASCWTQALLRAVADAWDAAGGCSEAEANRWSPVCAQALRFARHLSPAEHTAPREEPATGRGVA